MEASQVSSHMTTLRIEYDSSPNDVVDRVNEFMRVNGLTMRFEWDGLSHEGYEEYVLKDTTEN